ncbi:hypothetical protein [Leekyejoonella antrihumi]|uniref:SGNH hydrolase-type esterase domain-containing protein n=1 Tax=Leekyejoonella antrihumi TaxID=1660198 RepID=A0A563E1P8_9MICO|nr:hypothetical protein [Leekyejoonella antrihumi]TWP36468.1 hypothetical protein FGL98_09610 [Leekyejoonella antrihumi]
MPTKNYGDLPQNVANICTWTWMCSRQNIHPNDAGYAVIAKAVVNAIPTAPPTSPTSSPSSSFSASSSSSSTVTTGPPVITDGPAGGGHDGLLLGFGLFGGAAIVVTGGAAWRVKRR